MSGKITTFCVLPDSGGIVWCRTVPMRERLLWRPFGEMHRVTIIVPGGSVEELSVKEIGTDA